MDLELRGMHAHGQATDFRSQGNIDSKRVAAVRQVVGLRSALTGEPGGQSLVAKLPGLCCLNYLANLPHVPKKS